MNLVRLIISRVPFVPALVKAKAKNYLVLKKHYEMIEETSFYDAMTGIFNRRYLDNYLKKFVG